MLWHLELLGHKITGAPMMFPVSWGCNSTADHLERNGPPTVVAAVELEAAYVLHKHALCLHQPHMLAVATVADP